MKHQTYKYAFIFLFIIGAIALILFLFSNNDKLKLKLAHLEGENKVLKTENRRINSHIKILKDSIADANSSIQGIMLIETMIMQQLGETQKELNKLKKEYEKATNHARNYNADSVRLYFSNLR